MTNPQYEVLKERDLRAALSALGDISDSAASAIDFARAGVQVLTRLVPGELTTLSSCDLRSGHRSVLGIGPGVVGVDERAAFDRHFHEHPLVRYHSVQQGPFTHRITDSLSHASFRETPLYNDYYRRVGLSHALAIPLRMDGRELASFVLNRAGRDFDEREVALLDVLRRPLSRLFDRLNSPRFARAKFEEGAVTHYRLTPRETEVLAWVATGKLDSEIATLMTCSTRTVHKHLQRVYAKLGVETRTAAVMRILNHC